MPLCDYKNIFGSPGTGTHSIRIFTLAFFDILFTLIGSFIITFLFLKPTFYSFVFVFISLVILGIILHWLFCVKTKLNNLIGL